MNLPNTPASQPVQTRDSNANIDPSVGYEKRDVNIASLLWLALAIAGTIVATGVGVWALLSFYQTAAKRTDPRLSPLADVKQVPPLPHLQATPNRDYREFQLAQEAAINTYGWVDKQQGVVHLPIERAMELLLEQGLPKTPAAESLKSADAQPSDSQAPTDDLRPPSREGGSPQ